MSNNNKTPPAPPPAMPTVLKKHVAAVHTSGELSLVERKIANILLLNAYDNLVPSDGSDARHTIPVSYLGHMVGWEESKNVTALKAALRSLQKTVVEFNVLKDGREDWESMSLLSYARVRDGLCTYGYVGELARKLHDPEVFATINVGVQKRFKGGYSLTLYENCVRFKNVKSTGWWDLEKFRRLMGAEAAMYDDFKRLSAFVVKKSVEEINAVSDIRVVPEYRREGRKVVAIRFAVEENPQQSLFGPNPLDDEELVAIRSSKRSSGSSTTASASAWPSCGSSKTPSRHAWPSTRPRPRIAPGRSRPAPGPTSASSSRMGPAWASPAMPPRRPRGSRPTRTRRCWASCARISTSRPAKRRFRPSRPTACRPWRSNTSRA